MHYSHIDEVWPLLLRGLLDKPKVDCTKGSIREHVGSHFVLDGSREQFLLNPRRRLSPIYASAELLWYLSREKSGDMIKAYAPQYEKFLDQFGYAFGAYGGRLANNLEHTTDGVSDEDLLHEAICLLSVRGTTKKCVISLWRPEDLVRSGGNAYYRTEKDIPCTLTWQFLRRGERVHMIVNMRSNDVWLGVPYDVYCFTMIQRYVAAQLGCTAGEYHHIAGSMHLYERNALAATAAAGVGSEVEPYYPSSCGWSDDDLANALCHERAWRLGRRDTLHPIVSSVLSDAVGACTLQWGGAYPHELRSPGLRAGMKQYLEKKL